MTYVGATRAACRWIGFSDRRFAVAKDDGRWVAEGADIRQQSLQSSCQRVEPPSCHYSVPRDNAFHWKRSRKFVDVRS